MIERDNLTMLIRSDAERWLGKDYKFGDLFKLRITRPGFICIRRYRIVHYHKVNKHLIRYSLSYWLWGRASIKFGISIAPDVIAGKGLMVIHYGGVFINGCTILGNNITIYNGVMLGESRGKSCAGFPKICDDSVLYPGVKIFGGITVGCRSQILTNSVVIKDIPDDSIESGVPCQPIRKHLDNYFNN